MEDDVKRVIDFLWFIEERKAIKNRRDSGMAYPWTNNKVLAETKFTNLDRNDDYGTRSLFSWVKGMDLFSTLFYIVFFRCCYSSRNFLPQMKGYWQEDLIIVHTFGIKNLGRNAYQLYLNKGQSIGNFLSTTAFDVVDKLYNHFFNFYYETIENIAGVIADDFKTTFGKRLIFLGSEIAKDLSSLFPRRITPDSMVVFNTGAIEGLKYLGLTNEPHDIATLLKVTGMSPSILEHSLCEFSKLVKREEYYSKYKEFYYTWIYKPKSLQCNRRNQPYYNAPITGAFFLV